MATGFYLVDNPNPHTGGGRHPRREEVSGVIFGHTTENIDLQGADTAAENVVGWQSRTTTYSSYHSLCDSDSIVPALPYDWESFGALHGANRHAIHLSAAYQGHIWGQHLGREEKILGNFALMCLGAMRWVKTERGIDVPLRLLTREEAVQKQPGFISHGMWQADRSDPANNRDNWFWNDKVFPIMRYLAGLGSTSGRPPVGALDRAWSPDPNTAVAAGWAADPDDLNGYVKIHVYVDGAYHHGGTAAAARPDVAHTFPEYGENRGFSVVLKDLSPGSHRVDAYAIDDAGEAPNTHLGTKTVNVAAPTPTYPAAPFGDTKQWHDWMKATYGLEPL